MPFLRHSYLLILVLCSSLILSGCESVYDDTKGWGVDLWDDIKKGSKQAADSTKEALGSLSEDNDSAEAVKEDKIEMSALDTNDVEEADQKGPVITPAPLKNAEKIAQPPIIKTTGKYAVHLSSNKSKTSAEKEWAELRNAFPKETNGLSLQLKPVKITGKGTFYRVLGAAFSDRADANKACEAFKRKKQYCVAVKL
ncbi:SPOR domain-containing protein [uncultured Kiloniella sp.]|uniref:SPOR domain-containing protein n=1 Tax=uncultured Kiloniella sp. TaxID=1133091 RepID=UPI00262F9576|nr:SPOR domain-containing protein [uncultured Kiloniella sp.]